MQHENVAGRFELVKGLHVRIHDFLKLALRPAASGDKDVITLSLASSRQVRLLFLLTRVQKYSEVAITQYSPYK